MRMHILRILVIQAVLAALLCGGVWQAAAREYISRSLLGTHLLNTGQDGGQTGNSYHWRLSYPKSRGYPGDEGSVKAGIGDGGYFYNSQGHGFFILTQQGGEFQTVWTGPRAMPREFGEVVGMQYDPVTDGPEAHLGTEVFSVRGGDNRIGNWWPGHEPVDPNSPTGLQIENHRFYDYIADDAFPEQIVISKWTTSQGITFVRKAYAWSYHDFDDFFIQSLEFTNTGDSDGDGARDLPEETLDPVYLSVAQWMNTGGGEVQQYNEGWFPLDPRANDDWHAYSDAPNYPVDPHGLQGKALPPGQKLVYVYDGDHPETSYDDTGGALLFDSLPPNRLINRAAINDGQFGAPLVLGMAPIAYSNSGPYAFAGPDAGRVYAEPAGDQPHSVVWYNSIDRNTQRDPQASIHTAEQMQDMLLAGIMDNPADVGLRFTAQTYGPYTLGPGESGKLVFCYVAGTGAQMVNKDLMTWMVEGLFENRDELPLGVDAILQNLQAARAAYRLGFDIPDSPPDVGFDTRSSQNAHFEVFWPTLTDNAVNPDYGEQDVIGYEIYRSEYLPSGPWKKIADIPVGSATGGEYTYEDTDSVAGFLYRYALQAVASGHSTWTNGTATLADLPAHVQKSVNAGLKGNRHAPFQYEYGDKAPVQVALDASDRLERKVRVVPNPFVLELGGSHRYPGSIDRFRFVNLPRKCEVYIFTASGDLIETLVHDAQNVGEKDWKGYTRNLISHISSGTYFFVVKSLVPGSEGKTQHGTFFVVR